MDLVQKVTLGRTKKNKLPQFKAGDTIGVHAKVSEGNKERLQLFKGVVIKIQGSGMGRSFTVRKMSSGVGVEKTFPFTSPAIDKIDVVSRGKVRRGRLFFLRGLKGRAARLQSTLVLNEGKQQAPGAADEVEAPKAEAAPAAEAPKTEEAKESKE